MPFGPKAIILLTFDGTCPVCLVCQLPLSCQHRSFLQSKLPVLYIVDAVMASITSIHLPRSRTTVL